MKTVCETAGGKSLPAPAAIALKKSRTQIREEFVQNKPQLVAALQSLGAHVKDTDKNGRPCAPQIYGEIAVMVERAKALEGEERKMAMLALEAGIKLARLLKGAKVLRIALYRESVLVGASRKKSVTFRKLEAAHFNSRPLPTVAPF